MTHRMNNHTSRGQAISIELEGRPLSCFEGETIATVLISHNILTFRHDKSGKPRGPVCNMGVCYECMVDVKQSNGDFARRRACMTLVADAMSIRINNGEKTR